MTTEITCFYCDGGDYAMNTETGCICQKFFASLWFTDLAYGGPEEGGWYYSHGTRDQMVSVHLSKWDKEGHRAIADMADYWFRYAESENEARPSIHSVTSRGQYEVHFDTTEPAAHFPAVRPHYE